MAFFKLCLVDRFLGLIFTPNDPPTSGSVSSFYEISPGQAGEPSVLMSNQWQNTRSTRYFFCGMYDNLNAWCACQL